MHLFEIFQGMIAVLVLAVVFFVLYAVYVHATTVVERMRAGRPRPQAPTLRLVKTEPKPEPKPIADPEDADWLKDFG
jgi:hypothetical protein